MLLRFTKMHGLGNDFMVVDAVTQKIFFSKEMIRRLGDRHFGIGFDQLLVVEPPYDPELDFHYRIFNQDGSEVQMCGNGARCFVRFVTEHELTNKREIKVSTMAGTLTLKLNSDDSVTVNMGKPVLELSKIPVANVQGEPLYPLVLENKEYLFFPVSMGNPHAVFFVDEILEDEFFKVGKALQDHEFFPEKVNVEFAVQKDPNSFEVRVFERGCGETLACGTGACASAVSSFLNGYTKRNVTVELLGGKLEIEWNKENNHVYMTGPAKTVFDGNLYINCDLKEEM